MLLVGQIEYPLGLPSLARSPRAISYSLVMVVAHHSSTSCSCSIHLLRLRRPRATPPCLSSALNHSARVLPVALLQELSLTARSALRSTFMSGAGHLRAVLAGQQCEDQADDGELQ